MRLVTATGTYSIPKEFLKTLQVGPRGRCNRILVELIYQDPHWCKHWTTISLHKIRFRRGKSTKFFVFKTSSINSSMKIWGTSSQCSVTAAFPLFINNWRCSTVFTRAFSSYEIRDIRTRQNKQVLSRFVSDALIPNSGELLQSSLKTSGVHQVLRFFSKGEGTRIEWWRTCNCSVRSSYNRVRAFFASSSLLMADALMISTSSSYLRRIEAWS